MRLPLCISQYPKSEDSWSDRFPMLRRITIVPMIVNIFIALTNSHDIRPTESSNVICMEEPFVYLNIHNLRVITKCDQLFFVVKVNKKSYLN